MILSKAIDAAHCGARVPLVMGIINITPDSFSDGGEFFVPDKALVQARRLREEGADILDLGAESTRPGFTPISAEEEWRRLSSVVDLLCREKVPLSVDTTKSIVARQALARGVDMINDIWGLHSDPDMASTIAQSNALAVIMHNRHEVDPELNLWDDWRRFFDHSLTLAEHAGLSRARLVLDPGVGFGKTPQQSLWATRELGRLKQYYGLPVLLGLSRKSMFGYFLGREVAERLPATLSANLYGQTQGAAIWRVHDVQAHQDALRIQNFMKDMP